MSTLFDIMPGLVMPVGEVMSTVARMWQNDQPASAEGPSAFRASQMNVVLHFGLSTLPDEALALFDQAIRFAQVYPCRIVVLCPLKDTHQDLFLQGKLFSQCYIGQSTRQMCCCEAVMLGYPVNAIGFLENQVSIWLENDLPVYHWLHRVPARRIEEFYLPYLKLCTRVIYDSCVEGPDYAKVKWPRPEVVMDLAYARLLPVRQSIGQFLSSYPPETLVDGLLRVECRYEPGADGEAANLLRWQEDCLEKCAHAGEGFDEIAFGTRPLDGASPDSLEVEWQYDDGSKKFLWIHSKTDDNARIRANFGKGQVDLPQQVKPMVVERTIAEALFF
jgi:hypothetical protein